MFFLTPEMVTEYDLPPEMMQFFGKGNMSVTLRRVYEPVVGPAIHRVVDERPHVIRQVLGSKLPVPAWSGFNGALIDYMAEVAQPEGLTATEYFFGLEAGRESACLFYGDAVSVLGLLLLRDEPVANIRAFAELVNKRMGMKLEYGEVWRMKRSSLRVDWLKRWGETLLDSPHVVSAIRLGVSAEGCLRFMQHEDDYVSLALAGVPLLYALECGVGDSGSLERVRRSWEEGIPAQYAKSMLG